MWNFFGRNVFPYIIEQEIPFLRCYSIFRMSCGSKKTTGEKVTIFSYDKRLEYGEEGTEHARTAINNLRKFKHPSILTYVDSFEDDCYIYLITNRCLPLMVYLKENMQQNVYLAWGLATIAEALIFLNSVNLRHNNVFHGSVFVNEEGSWQLGELGYVTPVESDCPSKIIRTLSKYCPQERSSDSWSLGVLIWETFNGDFNTPEDLQKTNDLPSELRSPFQLLVASDHSEEQTIRIFITSCHSKNLLSRVIDNLNNYHLKDDDEKNMITKDILDLLSYVPKEIILKRVLVMFRRIYQLSSTNTPIVTDIVGKISTMVDEEEFTNHVGGIVTQLFSLTDRVTRLNLLSNVKEILIKADKNLMESLFSPIAAGFSDASPQIRNETIKSMIYVAPKLSKIETRQKMLQHLIHTQTKEGDPCLRSNATICLAKTAHFMESETRKRVVLCAFLKALDDPASAVRTAAVKALAVTHHLFPMDLKAKSILPRLVCLAVDPEIEVRQNVFQVVRVLLQTLEKVSRTPQMKGDMEKDVDSENSKDNNSWTKWAFAALAGRFMTTGEVKLNSENQENEFANGCRKYPCDPQIEKESTEVETMEDNAIKPDSDNVEDARQENQEKTEGDVTDDLSFCKICPSTYPKKRKTGPMKLGTRLTK